MSNRTEVHHVHLQVSKKRYESVKVGWEATASPCTVVRCSVRTHFVSYATVSKPCFCSETAHYERDLLVQLTTVVEVPVIMHWRLRSQDSAILLVQVAEGDTLSVALAFVCG